MKLTIIDKYIAKELLVACLSVLFVLLIIVLSTEVVHLLKWVSQGTIPFSAFISYLLNSLFEFGVVLIPLSLLMGILLAFGRLYQDSEMAAIMSAGIGPMRWYRPLMLVAIPTTVLLLILLMYVKPLISHQRALINADVQGRAEVDSLSIGRFNRAANSAGVLFLESENENSNQMDNVFLQQQSNGVSHVDVASYTNTITNEAGQRYMLMHDGIHYAGNPGDVDFRIIKYKDYAIRIDKKQVDARLTEKSKTMAQLWASSNLKDSAELQWRLTLPLATIIVAIMALPLSYTSPRSGRYSKLAVALVIYLIYSNLLGVGKTWIVQEKVPVWIGTWWVHILGIILTLFLLQRQGYFAGIGNNSKITEKSKDRLEAISETKSETKDTNVGS
jgi:lipopolysaccharide export system permease protein